MNMSNYRDDGFRFTSSAQYPSARFQWRLSYLCQLRPIAAELT